MLSVGKALRRTRNQFVKLHQYLGIKRQLKKAVLQSPPIPVATEGAVAVHMLCSHNRVYDGIATLKSFYRYVDVPVPLLFHDDGSLTAGDCDLIQRHLPGIRLIYRRDADPILKEYLLKAGLKRCVELRRFHNLQLKLFDFAYYANGQPYIQLDSDILFLKPPIELMEAARAPVDQFVDRYNADQSNAYTWTAEESRQFLGIDLLPRINSGLMCVRRDDDTFPFFERASAMPILDPKLAYYSEQSLTAMESSRRGARPLPDEYDVAGRYAKTGGQVVTQHYCSTLRPQFYTDFCRLVFPELMAGHRT
jgi:hypothetical protein